MKKFSMFFLLLQLFNTVLYAQVLSFEEKQTILRRLEDVSNKGYIEAIYDVIKYDVPESKQVLERDFWLIDKFYRAEYLLALQKYGSSVTRDYANEYWNILDSMQITDSLENRLLEISKIYTIRVLFLENDFQKVYYIYDLASKNKRPQLIIQLLPLIIKNNPENSEQALNLLMNYIKNSNDENVRLEAIFYYEDCYGADSISQLIVSFSNDNSTRVRFRILNKYFLKYKSRDINYAIKQSIKKESDTYIKQISSRILLNNYGSVEDYNFISNENITELNPLIKNYYSKLLNRFLPVIPSSNVKIEELLDTLISYNNQSSSYNWLKDEGYKNQLLGKIQEAQNYLSSSDSVNCYKQIKSFQTSIQQVYSDSAGSYPKYVSKDAYKFLYYYPQYILERLPSPSKINTDDINNNNSPLSEPMVNQRSHFMRKEVI